MAVNVALSVRQAVDDRLPQTQCTRCGYADCSAYAEAIATDAAPIDRCPPGGAEGIERLAALTGLPIRPLDPACGIEAPRRQALIDENWCIGCTLCLDACPVDAIVGGPKAMHTVLDTRCTGCELCLPACPVDCISLIPASGALTGWAAWSETQARQAQERYQWHRQRLMRDLDDRGNRTDAATSMDGGRQAAIAAALARSRAERNS